MTNKKLLNSKRVEYGDTQAELAEYLGISETRLSAKMNYKQVNEKVKPAMFTQNEIYLIMKRYRLTPEEVVQIFLADQ